MAHSYLTLFYGFCVRRFTILRRYPLNFVGIFLNFLFVFLMIVWGGMAIAPVAIGNSMDALVVGYFLFATVQSTFFFLSGMVNNEATFGTLQQLYVSRFRFSTVTSAAVAANVILSVGMGVLNLLVILLVTGETLTIDVLTIAPILSMTLLHAIGFSFLLGGTALLYKRIQNLYPVVQFVFIGLISFALTDRLWPKFLPVGQGAAMLHEAMAHGTRLWQFPAVDYLVLTGTAVVYLAIGYLAFYRAQHRARQKGLLDDY